MSDQNQPSVDSLADPITPDSARRELKAQAAAAAAAESSAGKTSPARKRATTAGTSRSASRRVTAIEDGSETPSVTTPVKRAAPRSKQPDLKKDLREFASARPQGWNHEDWLAFLEDLQSRGHNISDREAIGVALERERLLMALGQVRGIGPLKRQAIAEHYNNLWELRHADPNEISTVGSISLVDAERIKSELF